MSNDEVTFNIQVTMKERWVDDFCTMLKWIETCGNIGHSSVVGFYADGDGDFRPKFKFDREFETAGAYWRKDHGDKMPKLEVIFDAG